MSKWWVKVSLHSRLWDFPFLTWLMFVCINRLSRPYKNWLRGFILRVMDQTCGKDKVFFSFFFFLTFTFEFQPNIKHVEHIKYPFPLADTFVQLMSELQAHQRHQYTTWVCHDGKLMAQTRHTDQNKTESINDRRSSQENVFVLFVCLFVF